MMRLLKRVISISMLVIPLMGSECSLTTLTSSETSRIICETADFYRFKPYRQTWDKLTKDEQDYLLERLDAYRKEKCPEILKGK